MRRALLRAVAGGALLSFLSLVGACKRTPPPSPAVEGGADASARPEPAALARDAAAGPRVGMMGRANADAGSSLDAGARGPSTEKLAALPLASDKLEVVAVGTSAASKVLWLTEHGSRVWLSGRNLDAYAEGDGPLVKGPDWLAKFPYKPGVHSMRVVGAYPHLFALRTKNVNGRLESPEATLFVYTPEEGGPGTWAKAEELSMLGYPHDFVAYRDGALVVDSQIQFNSEPYFNPPGPGTTLTYLRPDGKLEHPTLGLHPHFLAWGASSDRTSVSFIGTIMVPPKKGTEDTMFQANGTHVVRVTSEGVTTAAVQRDLGIAMETYLAHVHDSGGKALAIPPHSLLGAEGGWRPNGRTMFVIEGGKATPRAMAGNDSCAIADAKLMGESIFAIRDCMDEGGTQELVRLTPDGKTERVALPKLVKDGKAFRVAKTEAEAKQALACKVSSIMVRPPSDLWATATCDGPSVGGLPVVLRNGRPQEPIVLP